MTDGLRFSDLYLDRSELLKDSIRFRNRLVAYYRESIANYYSEEIVKSIELNIGARVPIIGFSHRISKFFELAELRDLLDSITIIYKTLTSSNDKEEANAWKNFVSRVLSEENLGYQLDDKCGVHYRVDEEFERNRFSTLKFLDNPRYKAVRTAYDDAHRYLDNDPIDTKGAVKSMFESIEILVKQMIDTQNLNKWIVEHPLKEKCLACYASDDTAKKVLNKMFDGFSHWVDSIHFYRHGQANTDPVVPPLNMAIYTLSSGTAFLRWLIELNNEIENHD